jgi:hypothetical protein
MVLRPSIHSLLFAFSNYSTSPAQQPTKKLIQQVEADMGERHEKGRSESCYESNGWTENYQLTKNNHNIMSHSNLRMSRYGIALTWWGRRRLIGRHENK